MTTPVLAALEFYPPLVNPSPQGLYPAVTWTENPGPTRWLDGGIRIRPLNYGGEDAFGVWDAPWCGEPGSAASGSPGSGLKHGTRPELPDPFQPWTVWAYDECDPTLASQAEVRERALQNLRLLEPVAVEIMFASQLTADSLSIAVQRDTVREAIAYLEGQLAKTNTLGQVHASPEAAALEYGIVLPSGAVMRTPLGHQWVFGGGYVDGLGDLMVATSPVFGWRDTVQLRTVLDQTHNTYAAVAERSVALAYEKLVAAVYTNVEGS